MFGKKPDKNTQPEKPLTPMDRKAQRQHELDEHLQEEQRKKMMYIGIAGVVIIVLLASGYFFFLKPYNDAMNLVKQSEQLIAEKNYAQALTNLGQAKIISPGMKGLNYRAGLVQMLQMDFSGAEDLFNKEIIEKGHVAGAELALGFLYTIDAIVQDTAMPIVSKISIIEEMSSVLELDITLKKDLSTLDLADQSGCFAAITHFARAREASDDFVVASNVGLAYAHALDSNRDAGTKSYTAIMNLKDKIPMLVEYYNGIYPKLGMKPGVVAKTDEEEKPVEEFDDLPVIPTDELPSIPDDLDIEPLPDDGSSSSAKKPPWRHIKSFKQKPTVKPFKISKYLGKNGEIKFTLTMLNIYQSGKSVGREGQTRKMPKTNVMVTIIKLTEDEIILKEDNLYTYTWHRERNTWFVVENVEE
ncbi:hypothetical protein J7L05_12630 [bacterium]|nr:hypothetical protein [bacterium]